MFLEEKMFRRQRQLGAAAGEEGEFDAEAGENWMKVEKFNPTFQFSVHKMNFGTANTYLTDEASKTIDGAKFIPAKNPADALSIKSA